MVSSSEKDLYDTCGGVLCLDFTNTVGRSARKPWVDHLTGYGDLLLWSRQAGCVSETHARKLARAARDHPESADEVFARARELREATFRTFSALVHGRRPAPADLATINVEVARAMAHARVERTVEGYEWSWERPTGTPSSLAAPVWPIARSTADLLTSPASERVKECASEHCLWLFLDKTKNHGRRWCEMASCGNRAKVREHRRRKRKE